MRIAKSSKFQGSALATVIVTIPFVFTMTDKNLDRDHKQQACIAYTVSVAGLWGISIHATGKEDTAARMAGIAPPTKAPAKSPPSPLPPHPPAAFVVPVRPPWPVPPQRK